MCVSPPHFVFCLSFVDCHSGLLKTVCLLILMYRFKSD